MLGAIAHFIAIALITLPVPGLFVVLLLWLDRRKYNRVHDVKPHLVISP